MRAYVTVFSVTNFFIPLVFLTFCYGAICAAIWDNFNSKTGGGKNNNAGQAGAGGDGDGSAAAKFRRKVNRLKSGMNK